MNDKQRAVFADFISGLFIMLFVYAAFSKIQDFEKFNVELAKSPILNFVAQPIAILIPIVEIMISIMLIIKRLQYVGLYSSLTLMTMFSAYIVLILNFSSYIPCSCGGVLQNMTWIQHLIFNLGFVILAILAVLVYPNKIKNLSAVRGQTCTLK